MVKIFRWVSVLFAISSLSLAFSGQVFAQTSDPFYTKKASCDNSAATTSCAIVKIVNSDGNPISGIQVNYIRKLGGGPAVSADPTDNFGLTMLTGLIPNSANKYFIIIPEMANYIGYSGKAETLKIYVPNHPQFTELATVFPMAKRTTSSGASDTSTTSTSATTSGGSLIHGSTDFLKGSFSIFNSNGAINIASVVKFIFQIAISVASLGFLFTLAFGGVTYLTASGNEEQVDRAKRIILAGVVGLIVCLAAFGAGNYVLYTLGIT